MYSDKKLNQKNMKECDKRKSHISSKLHMIQVREENPIFYSHKTQLNIKLSLLQYYNIVIL